MQRYGLFFNCANILEKNFQKIIVFDINQEKIYFLIF
nr:MAG TPA: hypothetical protein [Caudoviricetes sp.]